MTARGLLDAVCEPRPHRVSRLRVYAVCDRAQGKRPKISAPLDVWELFRNEVGAWDRERFVVLALDGAHRVIGHETVAVGTLNSCLVHPREVFKALILANAAAFVAVHNHPSGEVAPSEDDRVVTQRLVEAGKLLGIGMLDHVIVTATAFHSFADQHELSR